MTDIVELKKKKKSLSYDGLILHLLHIFIVFGLVLSMTMYLSFNFNIGKIIINTNIMKFLFVIDN